MVLVVCVVLGVVIGSFYSRYSVKANTPKIVDLNSEACQKLLEKPFALDFSLEGIIEEKKDNNILVKFNDQEKMWVSLHEGYRILNKNTEVETEMSLDEVAIGSKVVLRNVGISDITENFLYADQLEIY